MALSASTDYTVDRDTLITTAYEYINELQVGDTASAVQLAYGSKILNMMVKNLVTKGVNLPVVKRAILLPEKGEDDYTLGPNGDHCSLTVYKTEISTAEASGQTVLSVDSITNMTDADNIGVCQDDGTMHMTTIASSAGSEVTLSAATTDEAAVDNHLYWYTNKIPRPVKILEVYRRDWDTVTDVPMTELSRTEYYTLSDKDVQGTPVNFYQDPQMTDTKFNVWPTADTNFTKNNVFVILFSKPFDDLDAATNDFEFPQEWFEPLYRMLAYRLAISTGHKNLVGFKADAKESLADVLSWDTESASVQFIPDQNG